MQTIHFSKDASHSSLPPTVLCLGNFDGVHIGHAELMHQAITIKENLSSKYKNIACGVWTFRESTYDILSSSPPCKLTSLQEKAELFCKLGADYMITVDFADVKNMSPKEFVAQILTEHCHCVTAVCGYNFKFGARGVGNPKILSELMDGNVSIVDAVTENGNTVSSTAIRAAIQCGNIEQANSMLGRRFAINAEVTHGRKVGSTLGFATLNQHFQLGFVIPAHGVYIAECTVDGITYPAVANVGVHPTFEGADKAICESHLFGYSGNAYGKTVKTEFIKYIRPEVKFDTPEQLSDTVFEDIKIAKSHFNI